MGSRCLRQAGTCPASPPKPKLALSLPSCLPFFLSFWATPKPYGGSQARGQTGATAASLHHSHSNAGSLSHCARPGIEPASLWIIVGLFLLRREGISHQSPFTETTAEPRRKHRLRNSALEGSQRAELGGRGEDFLSELVSVRPRVFLKK